MWKGPSERYRFRSGNQRAQLSEQVSGRVRSLGFGGILLLKSLERINMLIFMGPMRTGQKLVSVISITIAALLTEPRDQPPVGGLARERQSEEWEKWKLTSLDAGVAALLELRIRLLRIYGHILATTGSQVDPWRLYDLSLFSRIRLPSYPRHSSSSCFRWTNTNHRCHIVSRSFIFVSSRSRAKCEIGGWNIICSDPLQQQ